MQTIENERLVTYTTEHCLVFVWRTPKCHIGRDGWHCGAVCALLEVEVIPMLAAYCESEPGYIGNGEGLIVAEADSIDQMPVSYPMDPDLYPHYLACLFARGRDIQDEVYLHAGGGWSRHTTFLDDARGLVSLTAHTVETVS